MIINIFTNHKYFSFIWNYPNKIQCLCLLCTISKMQTKVNSLLSLAYYAWTREKLVTTALILIIFSRDTKICENTGAIGKTDEKM